MPRKHWILMGLLVFVLAATSMLPGRAEAYSGTCHYNLTTQADTIFGFPELDDYLDTVGSGAKCEDNTDHIYDYASHTMTICHFWDCDEGDFDEILSWGSYYENAWMKGRELLNVAVQKYSAYINSGSPTHIDSAYHYLGHVCHLIGDMGVPAHVHVDFHPNDPFDDDCYEDWMAAHDFPNDPALCLLWGHSDAVAKWGAFDVNPGTAQGIMAYLGDHCWEPKILHASFYYLVYTTTQLTDYFASDSYDGDTDDRLGLVSFADFPGEPTESGHLDDNDDDPDNDAHGHLTTIANHCYTRSMCATAAMYKAWRDYWDHVKPTTAIEISGAPEVHDGWRPRDVLVALMGDDNSNGQAIHDSGVHEVQWRFSGEDWQSVPGSLALFGITAEGVTTFQYRSMDRFANLEIGDIATVKIDKTPPEVSIISPTEDGFYLTSGTLTIDFEMSDVPSGIYSFSADMDGEPVSDDQVFSDLSKMAGYHTVTVSAEDFAGNTTTVSVTFSIKIHATVDIKPEAFSTNSNGLAMTAFVGFPPEYDVNLIDVSTTTLTVDATVVPAKLKPSTVGGYGSDGLPRRIVKFSRREVCDALEDVTDFVEFVVSGELIDLTEFWGVDTVRVFSPGADGQTPPQPVTFVDVQTSGDIGATEIGFAIANPVHVRLAVYDVTGRLVRTLVDEYKPADTYTAVWDGLDGSGRPIASGIYFCRINAREAVETRKMLLLK